MITVKRFWDFFVIPVKGYTNHKEIKKGTSLRPIPLFMALAERTGLEPATSGVTGRHSNQLNYRSKTNLVMVGDTGLEPVTLGL